MAPYVASQPIRRRHGVCRPLERLPHAVPTALRALRVVATRNLLASFYHCCGADLDQAAALGTLVTVLVALRFIFHINSTDPCALRSSMSDDFLATKRQERRISPILLLVLQVLE
jgi:hypothetical protein